MRDLTSANFVKIFGLGCGFTLLNTASGFATAGASAGALLGKTHGRGCAPSVAGNETGPVLADLKFTGFGDGVDDQAMHVASICMQRNRWIDPGGDQFPADGEDRRR